MAASSQSAVRSASVRTFFITSATAGRRNLLRSKRSAALLVDVLYRYRAQGRYLLHAFVIMPDHMHVLLSVGPEVTVARAAQLIKRGFSCRAAKELGVRGQIWQRGFFQVRIEDADQFASHKRFIHTNPVRSRMVLAPEEYRFSSAFQTYETDDAPPPGAKALTFSHAVPHD